MEPVIRIPAIGEQYRHYSGRIYFVIAIANQDSTNPDYPLTVVYKGYNGKTWCKTLSRFNETMLPTGWEQMHESHIKEQELKCAFTEGYNMANDKMTHDESLPCWASVGEAWANSDTLEPFDVGRTMEQIKDD